MTRSRLYLFEEARYQRQLSLLLELAHRMVKQTLITQQALPKGMHASI